jgi:hypothetical protein
LDFYGGKDNIVDLVGDFGTRRVSVVGGHKAPVFSEIPKDFGGEARLSVA